MLDAYLEGKVVFTLVLCFIMIQGFVGRLEVRSMAVMVSEIHRGTESKKLRVADSVKLAVLELRSTRIPDREKSLKVMQYPL